MDLNQIKAVVFDLEGTLLDRVKSREKFIEEQYERFHDYLIHVQLADFKKAFIELDDDEDNDRPDLYKEIIKRFHVDRLTWKDLFNDFEMHFYRYGISLLRYFVYTRKAIAKRLSNWCYRKW